MRIGVLGGGQLGRMLALAGIPLGHTFTFLDPSPKACASATGDLIVASYDYDQALHQLVALSDVVTYEFENVPAGAATLVADRVALRPSDAALETAQDRLAEKQMFERIGLPVARYAPVDSGADAARVARDLGCPLVLKTRRQGYDGKGQIRVEDATAAEDAWSALGSVPCIAEEVVDFDRELSIIGVRSLQGAAAFYPVIENRHRDGILRRSEAPAARISKEIQHVAEMHAGAVMDALEYTGVLTIELFQRGQELLGNEMAPRVHNSGHLTIEACATSQFANHIRAITGAPLGSTRLVGRAVMHNVIGTIPDPDELLSIPDAHVHLYGKGPRAGRKLGHVTLLQDDPDALAAASERVEVLLGP